MMLHSSSSLASSPGAISFEAPSGSTKRCYHDSSRDSNFRRFFSSSSFSTPFSTAVARDDDDDPHPHHHDDYNVTTTNGKSIYLCMESNELQTVTFEASWLWINDPAFIHPTSFQKTRTLGQYPGCQIVSAQIVNQINNTNYAISSPRYLHSRGSEISTSKDMDHQENRTMLEVSWDTGDKSWYDIDWLKRCRSISDLTMINTSDETRCTASSSVNKFLERTRVTKDVAISSNHDSIERFDYDFVMNTQQGRFQALHSIMEHGAILIENAPKTSVDGDNEEKQEESIVANLGKHMTFTSQLSHGSLYGNIFHVKSMTGANNIAYTSEALPPHQDLTYYESKPFLQLLHCVHAHNQVIGGESVLVDTMAAAEELRVISPKLFDILTKVPCTFVKQREGADMVSCKPHIQIDPVYGQVVCVNWSPPFEGPLLHLPPGITMEDYVCAYQAFEYMLDNTSPSSKSNNFDASSLSSSLTLLSQEVQESCEDFATNYTWEYALQSGEILMFNNARMVHARRSFEVVDEAGAQRHLIGCYTDAMDTISAYRITLREEQQSQPEQFKEELFGIRNAGNGYLGV